MQQNKATKTALKVVDVDWLARWQVFHRLQDLEIECYCQANQPLKANLDSPQNAIQIWSVTKQISAQRPELIAWLDKCWESGSSS